MPYLFTHAEHQARAMLMGMDYDWRDCTYVTKPDDAGDCMYFCGETLVELSFEQCMSRMKAADTAHRSKEFINPSPTPYCRE
jgi:hypothetical protein